MKRNDKMFSTKFRKDQQFELVYLSPHRNRLPQEPPHFQGMPRNHEHVAVNRFVVEWCVDVANILITMLQSQLSFVLIFSRWFYLC